MWELETCLFFHFWYWSFVCFLFRSWSVSLRLINVNNLFEESVYGFIDFSLFCFDYLHLDHNGYPSDEHMTQGDQWNMVLLKVIRILSLHLCRLRLIPPSCYHMQNRVLAKNQYSEAGRPSKKKIWILVYPLSFNWTELTVSLSSSFFLLYELINSF